MVWITGVSRMNHGQPVETAESGRPYRLASGDQLVVPFGHVVLENADDQPASVLVTTVVPIGVELREAKEAESPIQRFIQCLTAPAGGGFARVSIHTIARAAAPAGAGPIDLTAASLVVTAGSPINRKC